MQLTDIDACPPECREPLDRVGIRAYNEDENDNLTALICIPIVAMIEV